MLVDATSRRRELRIDAPALVAALLAKAAMPDERLRLYRFHAAHDRLPAVLRRELRAGRTRRSTWAT